MFFSNDAFVYSLTLLCLTPVYCCDRLEHERLFFSAYFLLVGSALNVRNLIFVQIWCSRELSCDPCFLRFASSPHASSIGHGSSVPNIFHPFLVVYVLTLRKGYNTITATCKMTTCKISICSRFSVLVCFR